MYIYLYIYYMVLIDITLITHIQLVDTAIWLINLCLPNCLSNNLLIFIIHINNILLYYEYIL